MSGGVGLNELIPMSGEDKKAAASNLAKFLDSIFRTDRIFRCRTSRNVSHIVGMGRSTQFGRGF